MEQKVYKSFGQKSISMSNKLYTILQGDCNVVIPKLPDEFFDLGFYSPPYNTGIEDFYKTYVDNREFWDYINWQVKTFEQIIPKIRRGGHIVINLPISQNRSPSIPYTSYIHVGIDQIKDSPMIYMGTKVAEKRHAGGSPISVGSIANKPNFLDSSELVIVYRKGQDDRGGQAGGKVTKEFLKDMASLWEVRPATSNRFGHPAVMPPEIAHKVFKWFTREGEHILDPFVGIGTSIKEAIKLNRKITGIELDEEYVKIIKSRFRGKRPQF